jgi:hypothetical protein
MKQTPDVRGKLLHKLLSATLDRTLEPRLPPGRPGRSKGSGNYQWTPEMDKDLKNLCRRLGPSHAKRVMQEKLSELRGCKVGQHEPRPDSVRNAVERRMTFLDLPTGQQRQKSSSGRRMGGPWTRKEIAGLLRSLGGDLMDESIEKKTKHSISAARAKLRRLGYTAQELRSVAFTVEELAIMFQVTPRQIRSWKEKGWLKTTRRRVTGKDLAAFIKDHHEQIPGGFNFQL